MKRLAVALALLVTACDRGEPGDRIVWDVAGHGAGALARTSGSTWIATVVSPDSAPRIRILHLESGTAEAHETASFEGWAPGLATLEDGGLVVVYQAPPQGIVVARRGSADGVRWEPPVEIAAENPTLTNARLVRLAHGALVLPLVHDTDTGAEIACYRSDDGGKSWDEMSRLRAGMDRDPALAEFADGRLLLVARRGNELVQSISAPDGWGALRPAGILSNDTPHALAANAGDIVLAWTDPAPDTTQALPSMQALDLATWNGDAWRMLPPVWQLPGSVPGSPALIWEAHRAAILFQEHGLNRQRILQWTYANGVATERAGRYSADPAAARQVLQLLCAHTLQRPPATRRLFVEAYLMRTLVAASAVFDSLPDEVAPWFEARTVLPAAIAYADDMLAAQDKFGYWPLGYGAVYLADMGAALGLFVALAPHVDAARVALYQAAAERFVRAMEEDRMILPSGAFGIGWRGSFVPRFEPRAARDPYLVSTALCGVELHAWLYRRTVEPRYRERALAALDYTLAELQPDGSFPPDRTREGPFLLAAYVQEGWMAADVLLEDAAVLERLRRNLGRHVDWLLANQHADGSWDSGADGEFARTPAIANFLMWYDERCEARADVREAVRRASAAWLDPDVRHSGFYHAGNHYEVRRAVIGRVLAALSRQRFVF